MAGGRCQMLCVCAPPVLLAAGALRGYTRQTLGRQCVCPALRATTPQVNVWGGGGGGGRVRQGKKGRKEGQCGMCGCGASTEQEAAQWGMR